MTFPGEDDGWEWKGGYRMMKGTRMPPWVENDFMSRDGAVDACAQKGPYQTKLKRDTG